PGRFVRLPRHIAARWCNGSTTGSGPVSRGSNPCRAANSPRVSDRSHRVPDPTMRVADLNWMQLEAYFQRDDRAVLPVGSTEQHPYLSLGTDSPLAERVAIGAAEPLGLPVFPVMPYGITPAFRAYPGSVTLSTEGFVRVIREILDGLHDSGARRILIV